jgi:glycerophosphoryl diester phosphodiesterase
MTTWQYRLLAACATLALVIVIVVNYDAARVYATNMFGALRMPGQPAFIAGHRGDRSSAPENTLPAMQNALQSELTFVETDIQLSADGVPVLIHDATVDRTTNGTGPVASLTLAQLKSLDAGSWYSDKYAGTTIPTLDEFLAIFANSKKKALLELKGFWTQDQVRTVTDLIYARGVQNRVIFTSFYFESLRALEAVAPAFPRVIIAHVLPDDPVAFATEYGVIAVLTSTQSVSAHPKLIATMHKAGLGVLLYTLNSRSRWSEALALGVDGIVTDKPSSLDRWLAKTAPGT